MLSKGWLGMSMGKLSLGTGLFSKDRLNLMAKLIFVFLT